MINLQKFCGTDPLREYIKTPFTHGGFTYATNGHIMVRVPKIKGVRRQTKTGTWDAPLKGIEAATFQPFPHKPLPPVREPADEECTACGGRGSAHDCPECTCDCEECDGSGNRMTAPKTSTLIHGVIFDLRYVAMMLALPGVEVAASTGKESPLLFKFDDGVGAMMPMRSQHLNHVEIEADKAA